MKHLKQSGYYALFRASLGAELNRYGSNLQRRDTIDTLLNVFIMYHVRNHKQVVDTLDALKWRHLQESFVNIKNYVV